MPYVQNLVLQTLALKPLNSKCRNRCRLCFLAKASKRKCSTKSAPGYCVFVSRHLEPGAGTAAAGIGGGSVLMDAGTGGGLSLDAVDVGGISLDAGTRCGISLDAGTSGGTSLDVGTSVGTSLNDGTSGGH